MNAFLKGLDVGVRLTCLAKPVNPSQSTDIEWGITYLSHATPGIEPYAAAVKLRLQRFSVLK